MKSIGKLLMTKMNGNRKKKSLSHNKRNFFQVCAGGGSNLGSFRLVLPILSNFTAEVLKQMQQQNKLECLSLYSSSFVSNTGTNTLIFILLLHPQGASAKEKQLKPLQIKQQNKLEHMSPYCLIFVSNTGTNTLTYSAPTFVGSFR